MKALTIDNSAATAPEEEYNPEVYAGSEEQAMVNIWRDIVAFFRGRKSERVERGAHEHSAAVTSESTEAATAKLTETVQEMLRRNPPEVAEEAAIRGEELASSKTLQDMVAFLGISDKRDALIPKTGGPDSGKA